MALTWQHDLTVRLTQKIVAVGEGLFYQARLSEGARVGRNPNHRTQDRRRYAKLRITTDNRIKPMLADRVMRGVLAKGVDQHVDVGQDHPSRST